MIQSYIWGLSPMQQPRSYREMPSAIPLVVVKPTACDGLLPNTRPPEGGYDPIQLAQIPALFTLKTMLHKILK